MVIKMRIEISKNHNHSNWMCDIKIEIDFDMNIYVDKVTVEQMDENGNMSIYGYIGEETVFMKFIADGSTDAIFIKHTC